MRKKVPFTIANISDKEIRLIPDSLLSVNGRYVIVVNSGSDGVRSEIGDTLSNSTEINFNTSDLFTILNIREAGSRADGTAYYVDGVRVIGGNNTPQAAQDQISVIQGGVPAMIGDFTGGAVNITTKGPSRNWVRSLEVISSSLTDPYHYNQVEGFVSGPLALKDKGNRKKERVLIASQKVNSELSFLKAQLNPHFLFNTLNSIYALANKKSENTSVAIVTLSELMRYMIYEANEKNVSLEKEIEHIKNYISLQLLRLKDSSGVRVNIHGNLNYKIEPLLLISFIENAFKYGTDFNGKTDIRIKITIREKVLNLFVYNTSSNQESKKENSGIGLENIKNRLNLLYPNSHTLDIISDVKSYSVNLTIKLKN